MGMLNHRSTYLEQEEGRAKTNAVILLVHVGG